MRTKAFVLGSAIVVGSSLSSLSHAQVTSAIVQDGTLGTTVTQAGNVHNIDYGTIKGGNQFHSFDRFSVGTGDIASFNGPSGVENIVSRVTGLLSGRLERSMIDGILRSTIDRANLFLINPAGVVFGPNASLDVSGAVSIGTADYIRLADGVRFHAAPGPQDALLTSAPVSAFGFMGPNAPAEIRFEGTNMGVGVEQTLTVVGGAINIVADPETVSPASLSAPSGQINIASVGSAGEVLIPSLDVSSFSSLGPVTVSGSTLDVSGDSSGRILIRGGQLVMDGGSLFAFTGDMNGSPTAISLDVQGDITVRNSSTILAATSGGGRGGDVQITASKLNFDAQDNALGLIATHSFMDGDAGDVSVNVGSLTLSNASIESNTFGAGAGGDLSITADSVVISNAAFLKTQTFDPDFGGAAGDITLNVHHLTLNGGTIFSTGGLGSAGNITIGAAGTVSLSGQDSSILNSANGGGDSGGISLDVARLQLADHAFIEISNGGSGQTGILRVTAREGVTLSGGGSLAISKFGSSVLEGGSIEVVAPTVTMNAGKISTQTASARGADIVLQVRNLSMTGGSEINASTFASGAGSNITIMASDSISISGPGTAVKSEVSESGSAPGGNIQIAGRQVNLSGGATISAQSAGTGDAGKIQITASDSFISNNGIVTTGTTQSDGGDIHLQVGRLAHLIDSQITTSVQGGLGSGGNIIIDPQFVVLERSQLIANAFGGNGGNIRIVANVFLADPLSFLSASSALGISGLVQIEAPITNLSESLAPLPGEFVQVTSLLREQCAVRAAQSSLVLAGRDSVPPEPGSLLASPLSLSHRDGVAAAGPLEIPDLRVGLTAGLARAAGASDDGGCAR